MVEIADIKDRDSLEAWLEEQPREVAIWIASRAAARVLPVWWDAVLTEVRANDFDLGILPILRRLLISSLAAVNLNEGIRVAADSMVSLSGGRLVAVVSNVLASSRAAHAAASVVTSRPAAAVAAIAVDESSRAVSDADFGALWAPVRTDAEQAAGGDIPDVLALWTDGRGPLEEKWRAIVWQMTNSEGADGWQFWIEWYDALLDGRPMLGDAALSWEMLEEIALIDTATWDAGPEVVNPVIREIWEGYQEGVSTSGSVSGPEPVSEDAKSAMKQRVAVNRDALAVATAGLLEDIGAFKDRVRGMNHLEPELREQVLAFVDEFTGKLSALLEGLPGPGESVNDDQAGRLVLWLRDFRGFLGHKLSHYGSAENMAEAAVPTGIILGATGIGSMLGMPLAGSVVGGLIANQMKPGQAARELMKPSANEADTK